MEDNRPTLAAKIGKRCRLWTASLRTLPDFLILGAAKAGTSSLYALLGQHPQIAPATHKEIQGSGGIAATSTSRWAVRCAVSDAESRSSPGRPVRTICSTPTRRGASRRTRRTPG
jgi:hypothetical protein